MLTNILDPRNHQTFVDILKDRASKQGDKVGYSFLRRGETICKQLTYTELDTRARAIAANLQNQIEIGDRALLLYPPGLEFISAFFGCLYAGVVPVPAYPPRRNQSIDRLSAIVRDAQASIT